MTLARKWNDLKPWIKRSFWEMLLACFLAGLFAAVIHLIARDSTAHTAASSYWKKSSFHRNFDGFPNYRREIWTIVIAGGIALLAWGSIPVLRFIRSWRIGITSLAVIGCFLAVS